MIISNTPTRISFFGGGTDMPAWFEKNGGAVLSTTIDKFTYIFVRYLPPFFTYKYRVVWSQIELVQDIEEIRHPSIRECLRFMGINKGVEIHHAADLPAQTGMGTSSAFTVGLLNALHALKGNKPDKMQLALDAIHVEQDLIKESVGSQDQTTCAVGGFNRIDFTGNEIKVTPVKSKRITELQDYLMLFFTGFSRIASSIEKEKIENISQNASILREMYEMVDEGQKILSGTSDIKEFGKLLSEAWRLKCSLSNKVSTEYIDYVYEKAIKIGAIGGKLLGAGGGGFLLLFVELEAQKRVDESLKLLRVPFKFETDGSRIVYE